MSGVLRRALLPCLAAGALRAAAERSRFEREYPATVAGLDIDLVNGDLTVRAGAGGMIRVRADIEWSADVAEDIAMAKREVRFEPRVEDNLLRVWVETAPERRWNRYQFRHQVEIECPTSLRLLARTVNGQIRIRFDAAPRMDIYVKNVNGEIDLEFASPLDADCRLRTRNGSIYSAFAFAPLPDNQPPTVTERGLRRIVSSNRYAGGRAGRGGPEIRVEGTNGDIRLRERKV